MAFLPEQSAARLAGREHVPAYPAWIYGIRIAQLVVAVIILGLDAYTLSLLSFSGNALNMFTTIATLIVCVYCIVAHISAPVIFNYWAVLSLDIFCLVFWLISFALMASQAAPLFASGSDCFYGYCYSYGLSGTDLTFAQCMAAVAGLGGLEFILFIISLTLYSIALIRHRNAGLHCTPVPGAVYAGATAAEKTAPVQLQPQPAYAQQPAQPQFAQQPAQLQPQSTGGYIQAQPLQAQTTGGYPPQQVPQQVQQSPQQVQQSPQQAPQQVPPQVLQQVPVPEQVPSPVPAQGGPYYEAQGSPYHQQ